MPSSAGPGTGGGSSSGGGGGFSGSFLGKQFSFASSGKSSGTDVISTQPSRPLEEPNTAITSAAASASDSDTINTDKTTAITETAAAATGGYKPVTNFEPQERVNPFDKEPHKSVSVTSIGAASNTTSSSSSISSSSISSRINRNGNPIKSPPPPTGPPPPPPTNMSSSMTNTNANNVNTYTNTNTNSSSASASASAYRNSFSSSLSKDKTSYGNYDSNTSVETITRMDTNTTNTAAIATATGAATGEASGGGITATTTGTVGGTTAITSSASNNDWRSAIGMRSASVYSAPAAVTTAALPGDTSGYDSNSLASQGGGEGGYNNPSDLPSYTRPSYSRSESNGNYLAVGVLLVSLTLRKT